mmetsp:Transcript_62694/g.104332  ORF Transcript_62694/g.104332 Transcript_62694/m.104332 type:complete len:397 (+) Transcript_62694:160-1350(+)
MRHSHRIPVHALHAASPSIPSDGAFAVAPMMDYTNRFLRYLLRRLMKCPTLYTEMVTANTLVHCQRGELPRFLEYNVECEHPLVLQIGGSDPSLLQQAAVLAKDWGYDALNLNCGCPSDRVAGSGCFGAALMRDPKLVADCCRAMADGAPGAPVTVKCRIGIADSAKEAISADEARLYDELATFLSTVSDRGGVRHFAVHARQAVLGGLSPEQNRKIPPLRHKLVHDIAAEFSHLSISLNGGIENIDAARTHISSTCPKSADSTEAVSSDDSMSAVSGVMVGRAVVARPWNWATTDSALYGSVDPAESRRQVLEEYAAYASYEEARIPQHIRRVLLAPAINLFAGEPNGKRFRAELDRRAKDSSLNLRSVLLGSAEASLLPETLDAPPGPFQHPAV